MPLPGSEPESPAEILIELKIIFKLLKIFTSAAYTESEFD